jgi:predicted Zn-dependent protease
VSSRRRHLLYGLLVVGVPAAAAAGWYYYWPAYQYHRAEGAFAAGEWGRVLDLSAPLTQAEPADPRALLLAGKAARRLRKFDRAEDLLARAGRRGADEAAVRRELALTRAEVRYSPVVESFLLKCLGHDPDDFEVLAALARGAAEDGRWGDAREYFDRALALRPDDFDLRLDRGYLRLLTATEYASGTAAESAKDFAELVRRDPNHYLARLYYAHCLLLDARLAEAKEHLRVCRRLASDAPEPLVGLAHCAIEENDWEEADRLLRQSLDRDPRSESALILLGDLHLRRERYADAADAYRKAIAIAPNRPPPHLKLSQALRGLKKDAEADAELAEYKRLVEQPGHAPTGAIGPPRKPAP